MQTNMQKFGKHLRLRTVISMFLALVMVLNMVPFSGVKVHAASGTVTVKFHFINNQGWEQVSIYTWGSELDFGGWPGKAVTTTDENGYYTYEVTKDSSTDFNYIFNNNNNGKQTADLQLKADTMAADEDGVIELWVNANNMIFDSAPTGSGPKVDGNSVTFEYIDVNATNVYLAGTMNGWNGSNNDYKFTKDPSDPTGTFRLTVELEPGVYEYKLVVDENWKNDPSSFDFADNGNNLLVVPGLVPATHSVKKGTTEIVLPSEIAYLTADGEKLVPVAYTSETAGVTVDGTTATLDGFSGDSFQLIATANDGSSTTLTVSFYEPGPITIKIHYDRADDKESEWNAWVWGDRIVSKGYDFEFDGSEHVAEFNIPEEDVLFVNSLSYKNRKGEWKAEEGERKIDLSSVLAGTVHAYVSADGSSRVDYSEAVKGFKINSVKYDRDTNTIAVQTSQVLAGTENVLSIEKTSGSKIAVTKVEKDGYSCILSIGEDLSTLENVLGTYFLVYDGNKYLVSMPNVYNTDEFENAYTYKGDDLGATWAADKTKFRVWAPTAESVQVQLYETGSDAEDGSAKLDAYSMTKDVNGTWVTTVSGDLQGKYYTYLVTVNGETVEACDPYARTTGVNGKRAMILNLDSTDPEGWADDVSPNKGMSYTDAVIYELHVRDLSIGANSGIVNKGKFLGLTETGTTNGSGQKTGLDHIKDLGVTHIHLLPSYDFGSIDETLTEEQKAADPTKQFNWGYDPMNYNVPEGSYSTDPYDGAVRVAEMKEMVQTLHENDINVIMDVVYNHVYDAGSFGFNMIVPKYFSRTNPDGTYSSGSGCGNDTASERAMVTKYIVESVKYWADEYHIDGFRFDLVGLIDADTINQIVEEVHKTHPEVVFYGEGWTMGTAVDPADTIMATQQNAYYTPEFAYFSDTIRDLLKGGNDENSWGFVQGATEFQKSDIVDVLIECFIANTSWIQNPTQVINYASCHDNYTLKDKINVSTKDSSEADRIKMNNLTAAIYMTAEGTPLIHTGEEMLRTKVDSEGNVIHNSYNSPDYINSLKWENLNQTEYQQVRDYYKGLIEFRKNHAALRLTTKEAVNANVTGKKLENSLVLFKVNGHESIPAEVSDGIVLIFNANHTAKTINMYDHGVEAGDWNVCVNDKNAGTEILSTVTDGKVTVEAYSALILVKGDTVDEESIYNLEASEIGKIIVQYVDEEGNVLEQYSESGKVGNAYTTKEHDILGYTLKTSPENASGVYTEADITIQYVYEKSADVVYNINYYNPDLKNVDKDASDIYIWGDGLSGKEYAFTGTYEDTDNNVTWLTNGII